MRISAALALCTSLVACGETPLTQLVVVVDSDLEITAQIDQIEIVVQPPEGEERRTIGLLAGDDAVELPVTLGVVHRGGPLGPVSVTARGLRGADEIVIRQASVFMLSGRTMVLELHLERACVGIACDPTETCEHGTCRSVSVAEGELREYSGDTPRLSFDGGIDECLSVEICNGIDDDCDERIDEGFDFTTDARHCGGCAMACPDFAGAVPACVAGECTIECEDGFGDCDGEPRTGCETSLGSPTDCGSCMGECRVDHGVPSCFDQVCTVDDCASGWGDCNEVASDGCEMRLDATDHCGRCGVRCAPAHATPSCAGGTCGYVACDAGWGDCDLSGTSGCETPLDTVSSCGACGNACPTLPHATVTCESGRCAIGSCATGWDDCNGMIADGCETPLDTLTNCGGCGLGCALAHAAETCAGGTCAIASCDAGWGDCDTITGTGCEASLETASRCGSCGVACMAPTPLCSAQGSGVASCESACVSPEVLCGTACVETATSLENCGACGTLCAPANASGECSAGTCGIASCDPGWGDCNASPTDGCETRLDSASDCGACDNVCDLEGASERCASGSCAVLACDALRDDCDGMAANGCETPLDTLTSCGACALPCALPHATETCDGGACAIVSCESGFADCDGMDANGCETPLDTLTSCGSCTGTCDLVHAGESCATGVCTLGMCELAWGDCDAQGSTGCEQSLRTLAHCGACGVACGPFPNATATCASGMCGMACNALWGDCSSTMPGCETALDTMANCGGCGVTCIAPSGTQVSCSTGACLITRCNMPGRADCNGLLSDGCEARIDRDELHCGACGVTCGADEECEAGVCQPS